MDRTQRCRETDADVGVGGRGGGGGRQFKLKIAAFRTVMVSGVGENGKGELNKIVIHLPYFFFSLLP